MPKIIIIGNSGGVGLRRSMQIGKWPKGKPTAYLTLPTREESESKWKAVIHRLTSLKNNLFLPMFLIGN